MYSLFLYFLWTTAHQRGTILSKCRKRKSELTWNERAAHHHHHSARLSTAWYVSSRIIMKNASVFFAGWSIAWYVRIRQNNHEKCVDGTKVLTWSGKETGEWQFYRFTMRFLSTLLVKLVTCFIICGNNVKITFVVWMKIDSVTCVAVFLRL